MNTTGTGRGDMIFYTEQDSGVLSALSAAYVALFWADLKSGSFRLLAAREPYQAYALEFSRHGLPYQEALKLYIDTYVTPEDREYLSRMTSAPLVLRELSASPEYTVRYRSRKNLSGKRYFNICYLRDGGAGSSSTLIGFRCVDDLVRREQTSLATTDILLEAARIGLWTIELETGAAPRMYGDKTMLWLLGTDDGRTPEENYEFWRSRIEPDYQDTVDAGVAEILKSGRAEISYPWRHPAWGVIHVRCGGIPDPDFKLPGLRLRGYHQDITHTVITWQKQEEELADANVKLRRAVDEANRANRAKSEFLSRMSHDIRTPVNGILGMLEIEEKNRYDLEKRDECIGKIRRVATHLLSLINDVLDMSKLESGEVELVRKPVDILSLADDCLTMVRSQAAEAGVTLFPAEYRITHRHVLASGLHVRQILINILGNAAKYNRPGGTIRFQAEELSADASACTLRFTISDTGIGISPEFLSHVFEPFMQEDSGARTHYKGTGLGLSIVKELTDRMGGEIAVSSQVNVGTVFTLTLPFAIDTNPEAETDERETEAADPAGMRVLLVEDNELNMEISQFMLSELGVEAVCAENGKTALELFEGAAPGTFDAILMDVMMPVMDGYEAARQIRALARPDAKTIPILALTANAFAEDAQKAREAGMNEHLPKPIQPKELRAALGKYKKTQPPG